MIFPDFFSLSLSLRRPPSLCAKLRWHDQPQSGKAILSFVGASLLANRANEQTSPQATIRWQACLPQNTSQAPSGRSGLSLSLSL
jgi:hypothetical protein